MFDHECTAEVYTYMVTFFLSAQSILVRCTGHISVQLIMQYEHPRFAWKLASILRGASQSPILL